MEEIKTKGKILKDFLREIDPNIEYKRVLGQGAYGLVLKVNKGSEDYRLKISKFNAELGQAFPLKEEYIILEDLAKTGASPRPVKLYENVPSIGHINKTGTTHKFLEGKKDKNAYLTEFIEGEILDRCIGIPEFRLTKGLYDLIKRIHKAGYEFRENSDFNANNTLLGDDGNLYLIDPLLLSNRANKKGKDYMTKEEIERIDTIVAMHGSK